MSWSNAVKNNRAPVASQLTTEEFEKPVFPTHTPDFSRLVTIDFETFYSPEYTLKKLSTSEYVRDPRFKIQMMGIRVGSRKTRIVPPNKIKEELERINWSTHSLLCHNTQFDGFILSHHFDIHPSFLYDTLSMARGLHSNEIGAGLDEVSVFYGGGGKLDGLEDTKGVIRWSRELFAAISIYCANDVDETLRVFKLMLPNMPDDEIGLIDLTCRMFCSPQLKVDIPRVEAELVRELAKREALMYDAVNPDDWADAKLLVGKEKLLEGKERDMRVIAKVIGSNDKFAKLLTDAGAQPPTKISPAWMKLPKEQRETDEGLAKKYAYAFAKDDMAFTELPNKIEDWGLDLDKPADVALMVEKQARLQALVDVRIAVKSTTNITRAQRFLTAGADGMSLPVGYAYYRAHTGRWGGQNKMNMQNLTRGGELRLSILAPKGHMIAVQDSGQIECRVNGWLWGQNDLMASFRDADAGIGADAYCNFASLIYKREITKADKTERFVGKVAVLGLGFQMGAPKFQMTLAKGALGGPPIFFSLNECKAIVDTYRSKNMMIQNGWQICTGIIEAMATGRTGRFGPISWEYETIWLPNGMCLKYPDLNKQRGDKGWDEWSYRSGDIRKKIYGGLLCENIIQALARIVVGWQMLQISKKYPVVMTTHDEIVALPKTAQAPACIKYMAKWMSTPPEWCSSLPLNCEGGYDVNYSK